MTIKSMILIATLVSASIFSHASTEIVYGQHQIISPSYDPVFKAELKKSLIADAAKDGYLDILNMYRFELTNVKSVRWDQEYKLALVLKGRNPNMYDDGVLAKIILYVSVEPKIDDVRIEGKQIKVLE